MAGKSSSYQKNLEFIAKDIGEKLIPFLTLEERLRGLSPKERLIGLTPEERLIGMTPEELRKIKQLLEEKDKKNQR